MNRLSFLQGYMTKKAMLPEGMLDVPKPTETPIPSSEEEAALLTQAAKDGKAVKREEKKGIRREISEMEAVLADIRAKKKRKELSLLT